MRDNETTAVEMLIVMRVSVVEIDDDLTTII